MPNDPDRLDAAILAALGGRGQDGLRSVIAGLWQAKAAAVARSLDTTTGDEPRPRIKVFNLSSATLIG